MKHAGTAALDRVAGLLAEVRRFGLVEKSRGVFYYRSKAFLHFHEDPAGLFADLRTGSDWERRPANTKADQEKLLRRIRDHLAAA